jgi:hypothetical protein
MFKPQVLMSLKCVSCFREIAGGPPIRETVDYLMLLADSHVCQTTNDELPAPTSVFPLSSEELAQLAKTGTLTPP